jgi:hypothetical protein
MPKSFTLTISASLFFQRNAAIAAAAQINRSTDEGKVKEIICCA